MIIKPISDIKEALNFGLKMKFVYIRSMSSVYVGKTPTDASEIKLDELLEAFFFDSISDSDYRILRYNGKLLAFYEKTETSDDYTEKKYYIDNSKFGKYVTVRDFIDYDEDGQAYISKSRLIDWEA